MTRLKNITNVVLGICYESLFALSLIGCAFFISFIVTLIYLKP